MRVFQRMPLAVLVTMLLVGPSFAQDQAKDKTKGGEKDRAAKTADQPSAEIPQFLMKVDLTPNQEQKIRKAVQTHNKKTQKVWSEFHRLHWQAVELEAMLSAANRLAGHDHEAHHEKAGEGQSNAPKTFANEDQKKKESASNKKKKNKTAKPKSSQAKSQKVNKPNVSEGKQKPQGVEQADVNILGMRIAVLKPDGTVREIRLAGNVEPREEQCEICRNHKQQLKTLWQKVHKLHGRLVQMEADHMVAIESTLTEQQLAQLKEFGQEKSKSREAESSKKGKPEARDTNPNRKE